MAKNSECILITGACGQIGTELTAALRKVYGDSNVIATDIANPNDQLKKSGPFEYLNILRSDQFFSVLRKYKVTQVYHLAAILSAKGEQNPQKAWEINMLGLFNVLEGAKATNIRKVFWPSSIAVFGPNSPKVLTPQHTITDPTTVYGISKLAGERWALYFNEKNNLDIRSIRYPGLISYKHLPGGGTTDYAIEIFHEAILNNSYSCFLEGNTDLPMMYMDDAIRATLELMESPSDKISIRSSYNVSGFTVCPADLASEIAKYQEGFKIDYNPDFRQDIADTWPSSIDDSIANRDWNWKPEYNLSEMTREMFENIKLQYNVEELKG